MNIQPENCDSKPLYMIQTQTRIFIKSLLYRLFALIATVFVTYYYTKNYKKSIGMGIMIEFFQTLLYYTYEQLWNNIQWGYHTDTILL